MSKLVEEGKSLDYETPKENPRRESRSRIWDTVQVFGIFACFIFIGVQLYRNFSGADLLTPDEIAAEERLRDQVESCVLVFWQIAEVLQSGQVPNDSLRCNYPGTPNIVARVDDDIIVRHPSPELLGYRDISIRRSNPVPVLQQ